MQQLINTDTVPAMLTPGEGVLNKGAMQLPGMKELVKNRNRIGNKVGGQPMHQKNQNGAIQMYSGGTNQVGTPGSRLSLTLSDPPPTMNGMPPQGAPLNQPVIHPVDLTKLDPSPTPSNIGAGQSAPNDIMNNDAQITANRLATGGPSANPIVPPHKWLGGMPGALVQHLSRGGMVQMLPIPRLTIRGDSISPVRLYAGGTASVEPTPIPNNNYPQVPFDPYGVNGPTANYFPSPTPTPSPTPMPMASNGGYLTANGDWVPPTQNDPSVDSNGYVVRGVGLDTNQTQDSSAPLYNNVSAVSPTNDGPSIEVTGESPNVSPDAQGDPSGSGFTDPTLNLPPDQAAPQAAANTPPAPQPAPTVLPPVIVHGNRSGILINGQTYGYNGYGGTYSGAPEMGHSGDTSNGGAWNSSGPYDDRSSAGLSRSALPESGSESSGTVGWKAQKPMGISIATAKNAANYWNRGGFHQKAGTSGASTIGFQGGGIVPSPHMAVRRIPSATVSFKG